MALSAGTRLGSYEVTAQIGVGGMGEVYRATDTKLKRQVAIKVLPESLAADPDRLARFQREAEVLASLNHPHIAAIYGLEDTTDAKALVMELIEGPTLADRIAQGAIPLDEALPIAKQIAEALEAAHEQGIVHRDLKPANIKVRPDGTVKVLDFGLAKAMDSTGASSANAMNSPTISMHATQAGIILGTAAYMSPEQAVGKPVDKRADLWAFGVVLLEMLTGKPVFTGETVSHVLASVLKTEPDWTALPSETPASIRRLLRRCLEKDRKRRLPDAADIRLEIEDALTAPAVELPPAAVVPTARRRIVPFAIASVLIMALAIPAARHLREALPPEMRVEINTPSTPAPLEFALSPDGRYIVFVASGDGGQRLWLRALDKTDAHPMAGTDGADYPFWSPDSRAIGFTATGQLKRIDIAGGPPQILASTGITRGGSWNADGTILFSASLGPLFRIAATGGEPVAATRLDPRRQNLHAYPQFLPDGRHFLYYATGTLEGSGLYLGSLDGVAPKRLAASNTSGAYLAPDMIVFVRQTSLMAQHLDLQRGELTGEPVRLADPVGANGLGFAGFSVSADGRLAYRGGEGGLRQLKWYDRTGKAMGVAGEPDAAMLLYPELSPDGEHVAVQRTVQTNFDVWQMDLTRGGLTRFTFDPAIDTSPLWSPDGMQIAFGSARKGSVNLYLKPSNGASTEESLLETPNNKFPQDWSKDGRFLLYSETDPKTGRDLWALPIAGNDRKPVVVVKTPFEELNGQFSPDGRWVAYETNESGRFEIVMQPFPMPTGKWQVSTGGGIQPRWRADGKELYFVAPDGKLMAASVTPGATAAGTPVALFPVTLAPGAGTNRQEYVVSRDGRFLINQPAEASTTTPITLILNWKP